MVTQYSHCRSSDRAILLCELRFMNFAWRKLHLCSFARSQHVVFVRITLRNDLGKHELTDHHDDTAYNCSFGQIARYFKYELVLLCTVSIHQHGYQTCFNLTNTIETVKLVASRLRHSCADLHNFGDLPCTQLDQYAAWHVSPGIL
jgi:hypothetical protein